MTTINPDKKDVLLDLINRVEDKISEFVFRLEDNDDIGEGDWEDIDDQITSVNRLLSQLKEEVNYG